jgi:hypothetical protein
MLTCVEFDHLKLNNSTKKLKSNFRVGRVERSGASLISFIDQRHTTNRLLQLLWAGMILDIAVLCHLLIGNRYTSLKKSGITFNFRHRKGVTSRMNSLMLFSICFFARLTIIYLGRKRAVHVYSGFSYIFLVVSLSHAIAITMENVKQNNPKISEGIILALASASAYLFAYLYEIGYAIIFKIPESLISVSPTAILTFGAILISIFLLFVPIANLFLMIVFARAHPALQRAIIPVILLFTFLIIEIFLFGPSNWLYWIGFLILFVYILYLQLIFPLITQRSKTYTSKLEGQEKTEQQFADSFVILRNRFGKDSVIIVMVFMIGLSISVSAGMGEAIQQKNFLVTNTTPELVILRIYGDNLICVPFDKNTGEYEPSFSIIKNTGETGLILRLENLGQLHLPKNNTVVLATPIPLPIDTLTPTITTP